MLTRGMSTRLALAANASTAHLCRCSEAPDEQLLRRTGIWYHLNQFYDDHGLSIAFVWVTTASMLTQARICPASARNTAEKPQPRTAFQLYARPCCSGAAHQN